MALDGARRIPHMGDPAKGDAGSWILKYRPNASTRGTLQLAGSSQHPLPPPTLPRNNSVSITASKARPSGVLLSLSSRSVRGAAAR
jgi:hypothetical protein